jgi:hypothetical protein
MRSTLVALFGVIAMACASDHPNQESPTRQNQLPPSIPVDIAKEFKERNQVKKDVELNTQEILKGLPFVFNDREISFGDEDLDVKNVFTSGAEVVVDGVRQTPFSSLHKQEGPRHHHCHGH